MRRPLMIGRNPTAAAVWGLFLLLSPARAFFTSCPLPSTHPTPFSSTFATSARSSLHLLHASLSTSKSSLMDAIITPKRVEALPGFSVVERIDGLAFVRYNHTTTPSSLPPSPSISSSGMEKRGEVLYLPGLDGSGCTLGPQVGRKEGREGGREGERKSACTLESQMKQ